MAANLIPPAGFTLDQDSNTAQAGSTAPPPPEGFQLDEDQYGTPGQEALTGIEGLARGVITAPGVAAVERGLTAAGVPGLTPVAQAGRKETNPWISGGSEAVGLGGSMLAGVGEGAGLAKLGEAAGAGAQGLARTGLMGGAEAAGPLTQGASLISKIASGGVQTGAEMAALTAGDELAKTINQDPGQSLGTAAINIGLSGIIGGAGGAVLGTVSPLWNASMEKMGIPKLIDESKAQYGFRQSLPNGDVPGALADELTTRLGEVDNMRQQMGDLKGDVLGPAMPEVTPANTAKIDEQINGVADAITAKIQSIEKSNDPYLKSAIPKLEFHRQQLLDATEEGFSRGRPVEVSPAVPKVAQEPISMTPVRFDENPNARMFPWVKDTDVPPIMTAGEEQPIQAKMLNANPQKAVRYTPIEFNSKSYVQKFNALDGLKRDFQGLVNYERNSSEDTALASVARDFASKVRTNLEDSKVWGDAGDIQRQTNAAIKSSIDAEKDAVGRFTDKSAVAGGRVVAPNKVMTLVNQAQKGTAGNKQSFLKNYIDLTNNLGDTINRIHTDAGLEAPIRMTPTPALNTVLAMKPSAGIALGNWLYDKGLASLAGHAGAEAAGAGIGTLVGHPAIGALIGERMLAPALTSLAKPLMETASRSAAFKGSLDYIGNVIRGGKALGNATESMFKGGSEVLAKDLMPTQESRDKLDSSLSSMDNVDSAMNVGGNLNHYLPGHSTVAASTAAIAKNYLNALKPMQPKQSPLDRPAPVDKMRQRVYQRALDIAQQPLMVLHYAKQGTLQQQDVAALNTIYPQLHAKIISSVYDQMAKAQAAGTQIPYKVRNSLSMLMGKPLDSTMSQPGMAAILMANAPKVPPAPPQGRAKRVSKSTAGTQEKVNQMYATNEQARAGARITP